MAEPALVRDTGRLLQAGVALGVGMGGFVDGIVFHQILQLHNMLSAWHPTVTVPELELNMVWDGVFHAFTWGMTLAGVILLFRAGRDRAAIWCGRTLAGGGLLGWGIFNLVEGVIDHHVLHLHHVVERLGPSMWDFVFLGSGILLAVAGIALTRGARAEDGPAVQGT
jgi:uncharacterized membrane protein